MTQWQLPNQIFSKYKSQELLNDRLLAFSVMLPQESDKVLGLKNFYAFFNGNVYDEIVFAFSQRAERYGEEFKKFSAEQINLESEFMLLWEGVNKNLQFDKTLLYQNLSLIHI
eukprot:TRINITY_DN2319_c0_g1_i1.p3 TRINITY_DN2319_c0_g1~~TRINITY_DN2319_c0_g1_i1.p3  ORF type:complete len:113 (+),score=14.76 TRINITY_DN2319_c0_g1_i1:257-595(+)